ncbi:MAG: xylulokinase, partial [Spirochaetota bacterium]
TGDKATLFSSEGNIVATSFSSYPTYYPVSGGAEQDPGLYWKSFCEASRALIEKSNLRPSDIGVVSFSGQMMAALPVDDNGKALRNSLIWADLRSVPQAEKIAKRIGEDRVYELTGHRLSASYSAAKIMWIRENQPDVYKNTFKFIHAKDFVASKLTGNICTDFSDATGMNLMDIRKLDWSEQMLEATGIEKDKLPQPVESTKVCGRVCADAASQSGLVQGIPVVAGGGDGPCATCGAGVVKSGEAYIYLGTSTWMGLASDTPIVDPQKRTFTFSHFKKGLYMPAGTMQAGGGAIKWFKDNLCETETEAARTAGIDTYDILNVKAQKVSPGSGGVIFLPYLMGERSPLWDPQAKGCFIGLTMVHQKQHMLRSVMEGVAYNMRLIQEAFAEQGIESRNIRMIGGGAKSPLWRCIFADIMEKPILRLNFIEEATSVGAAIAGGVGVGIFSSIEEAARIVKVEEKTHPRTENYEVYRKYYKIFQGCYSQLADIFDELSS